MPALEFFNGLGGFAAAGREYVTVLEAGQWTPAPWINVIANPQFGTLVSADGAGSTWSINAQQNQLTPWSNDPVSNAPAEVDLHSRRGQRRFVERDAAAHSRAELIRTSFATALDTAVSNTPRMASHSDLLQFVPLEDPLKISRLKIVNRSQQTRQLSITHYVEWVLGNQRGRAAPFIVTELDLETSALLARNPWSVDFQARVAFMDMGGRQQCCTGDRGEFIGRTWFARRTGGTVGRLAVLESGRRRL